MFKFSSGLLFISILLLSSHVFAVGGFCPTFMSGKPTAQEQIALRCVEDCLAEEPAEKKNEIFLQISGENEMSRANKELVLSKYSAAIDDFNVLWRLEYFGFKKVRDNAAEVSFSGPHKVTWANYKGDEISAFYTPGARGPSYGFGVGRKMRYFSQGEQNAIKNIILDGGKLDLGESSYWGHPVLP